MVGRPPTIDMGKKSFVLYADQKAVLEDISYEDKGMLLDALFDYVADGSLPHFDDNVLMLVFKVFKVTIDRDRAKYDSICERRKEYGKRGGVAKATKSYQKLPKASLCWQV